VAEEYMTSIAGASKGKDTDPKKAKKNLRICAGRCKKNCTHSVRRILTNQYLWDFKCSSGAASYAMSKSQQRTANCKQKFCLKLLKIHHMPNFAAAPGFR